MDATISDRGSSQRPQFATLPGQGRMAKAKMPMMYTAALLLLFGTWLNTLGPIAPLLVMTGALALLGLAPRSAFTGLARAWPLWFIMVLPIASSLWSTDPAISLRYGTQLSITVACGIVLASTLNAAMMLRVVFAACSLTLLICFTSSRHDISPQGPVWIGILGSKNQMGQLCQFVICSALSISVSKSEHRWLRLAAFFMMTIAAAVLAVTFSTGAILTTFVFVAAAGLLLISSRLSSGAKVLGGLILGMFLVPLLLIRDELYKIYVYILVDVLNKDVGLTGRDYLWEHADRMIALKPLLGYGYRSTWLGSSADTIGLLRWARMTSGAGFNFHDTLREWSVDFGLIGASVMVIGLLFGVFRVVARSSSRGVTMPGIFLASIVIALIFRAKVEVVFGPFQCSTVLISAIAALGYIQTRQYFAQGRMGVSGAASGLGAKIPGHKAS